MFIFFRIIQEVLRLRTFERKQLRFIVIFFAKFFLFFIKNRLSLRYRDFRKICFNFKIKFRLRFIYYQFPQKFVPFFKNKLVKEFFWILRRHNRLNQAIICALMIPSNNFIKIHLILDNFVKIRLSSLLILLFQKHKSIKFFISSSFANINNFNIKFFLIRLRPKNFRVYYIDQIFLRDLPVNLLHNFKQTLLLNQPNEHLLIVLRYPVRFILHFAEHILQRNPHKLV